MAALTSTTPTAAGATWTAAAVAASDTITANQLGNNGVWLYINNGGGSPDNITVSDGGFSPAGGGGTALANTVTNGTAEIMYISPKTVNLATGLTTITHSFITSVTYVLLPLG